MLILRAPRLIGYQDRAPIKLLKEQTFLQENVIQSFRHGDIAQVNIDRSRRRKRLAIKDHVQIQVFRILTNKSFQVPAVVNDARRFWLWCEIGFGCLSLVWVRRRAARIDIARLAIRVRSLRGRRPRGRRTLPR